MYYRLVIVGVVIVAVTFILNLVDLKTTFFEKLNYWAKQVLFGVIFGALAIFANEFSYNMYGAVINIRDAAPIAAALNFGGPAGIIAGIIGAIERFCAGKFWGAGEYTTLACSFSCLVSGLVGCLIKEVILKKKNVTWHWGFQTGILVEVFHMLMIMLTTFSDNNTYFKIVQQICLPMILGCGLTSLFSVLVVQLTAKYVFNFRRDNRKTLSKSFQIFLLSACVVCFFSSTLYDQYSERKIQMTAAKQTLQSTLYKAMNFFNSDDAAYNEDGDELTIDEIKKYAYNLSVGQNGYVCIYDKETGKSIFEEDIYNNYKIEGLNGLDARTLLLDSDEMQYITLYGPLLDPLGQTIYEECIETESGTYCTEKFGDVPYYVCATSQICASNQKQYIIVSFLPYEEVSFSINSSTYTNAFIQIIVYSSIYIMIYVLVDRLVIKNILKINNSLKAITRGNLNVTLDVKDTKEFRHLSEDINLTVSTLKKYIAEAETRMEKELTMAKEIQQSALPNVFPPFPDRKEFDIYASMDTAKEVGGDFYDFFFVNDTSLALVIADVSDKGIPAALFMMRAKSVIKSLAQSGLSVNETLQSANNALCENNDAGLFVTAWIGIINIYTGEMVYADAGHTLPLLKHGEKFEFVKTKHSLVLGGMSDIKYNAYSLKLEKGDELYLYTDGVTDAIDKNGQHYGEDRLKNYVNNHQFDKMHDLCEGVSNDIKEFAEGTSPFDDITMLGFKYLGSNIKVKTLPCDLSSVDITTDFIYESLSDKCPKNKIINQINVSVDEIISNIIKFAFDGKNENKTFDVSLEEKERHVIIKFIDKGNPFNPLLNKEVDVTKSVEEREIGGLGIFLVKKLMDNVYYEYKDEQNILTIIKKW